MKILAIETSCDETAAAVVENGRRICSNVVLSQIEEHKLYGGVVPEIASRRHTEAIAQIVQEALCQADCGTADLDAVAVTAGPGLIGALLVGVSFAKGLAYANHLPLVPVHHIRGHVAANYLAFPELEPPFLCLIVSGGHSHIVEVKDYAQYTVLGRTVDDAPGEAFDKVARTLGYDYPGGVQIDRAAQTGNPSSYTLPRPHADGDYNFSFSGLKTAMINLIHNAEQKGEQLRREDLAASFQQTVAEILTEKLFAAAKQYGYSTVACAGGVSANSGLRKALEQAAEQQGCKLFVPPLSLCGDNAAMIGAQGYYEYLAGQIAPLNLNAYATREITEPFVEVSPKDQQCLWNDSLIAVDQ